jgi:hypothetical protein
MVIVASPASEQLKFRGRSAPHDHHIVTALARRHLVRAPLGARLPRCQIDRRPVVDSSTRHATLVLADISGYTRFLAAVGAAHQAQLEQGETPAAYPLMTTLLDAIVQNLVPPFALAKLEGDAVFGFADDGTLSMRGGAVTACIQGCYASFREHLRRTEEALTCSCDACIAVSSLDLKFVLHHGSYVAQSIAGNAELLGPDVTTAHQMLKNDVVATTGWHAYALVTLAAASYLEIPTQDGTGFDLEYEHSGPISAVVLPLGAAG